LTLKKKKNAQDHHEYDVIKFVLNDNNEAELHIFACSICDEIKSKIVKTFLI